MRRGRKKSDWLSRRGAGATVDLSGMQVRRKCELTMQIHLTPSMVRVEDGQSLFLVREAVPTND